MANQRSDVHDGAGGRRRTRADEGTRVHLVTAATGNAGSAVVRALLLGREPA